MRHARGPPVRPASGLVTGGLDEATIETMTEALLMMKTTLIQEAHLPRRAAPAETQADADAREVA